MTWPVATANVRGAAANRTQNRPEHASHGGDLAAVRGRQGIVVPEQLVCAVDQMNFQAATPRQPYRTSDKRRDEKTTLLPGAAGRSAQCHAG